MLPGIFEDPAGVPRTLFWAASGLYLLFLVVTALALRSNLRRAKRDEGLAVRVRRSVKAATTAAAIGAAVAVAGWFPLQAAFAAWNWPYAFSAYLWWTLPLGAGAAAVWAVMIRSRPRPVTSS
ncbi:hypothetical protein [Glycomyces buryatensis]|uniref:Uncharacterized protein n=1 Tax=Glycomyces buryatensis TaxID=2570927 RepID=A0A4S8QGZ7_9ACTN|nr:hypothetical protein [Glycomyces buryatensis]THV43001.1 hypothetical protein FAB82_03340 [Glycomyces buryatensis]